MKKMIIAMAACGVLSCQAMSGQVLTLRFVNLPYAEGTLYVSVSADGKPVGAQMAEVSAETVEMAFDVKEAGTLAVQAFQDLNDDRQLDFDSYGRPEEPCVQTTVEGGGVHEIELKQY